MKIEHIRTMRRFKTFDLHAEVVDHEHFGRLEQEVYRNKQGDYIGARFGGKRPGLIKTIARLEISPETSQPDHSVCSVGKSAVDGKWYGWSHRAFVGFGPGDRIFDPQYGADRVCPGCEGFDPCAGLPCIGSLPFVARGNEVIETDEDARCAAVAFSDYVG